METGTLEEALATGYGIRVRSFREIALGNDAYARSYEATDDEGRRFFVKRRFRVEPGIALSARLRERVGETVLAPSRTLKGALAHPVEDGIVLLYPFIDGTNGFQKPLTLSHWQTMGESLRRIHDSQLPPEELAPIPGERFRVSGVPEFEATMERLRTATPADSVEEGLVEVFTAHRDAVERVIRRTAALGSACGARSWDLVPCHADLHLGNVLVDSEGKVYLIDWDAPRRAPRECDLVFFCDGGITCDHGAAEEAGFFAGYGAYEPDLQALTYYRYARILEDLVAYTEEATQTSFPVAQRLEAVRWLGVVMTPGKFIETTFRSDRRLGDSLRRSDP
ncbi:MAG: phosphotransferase enzyme family protein [Fimbriimonas sp.]